jgi:hypothetical protein
VPFRGPSLPSPPAFPSRFFWSLGGGWIISARLWEVRKGVMP